LDLCTRNLARALRKIRPQSAGGLPFGCRGGCIANADFMANAVPRTELRTPASVAAMRALALAMMMLPWTGAWSQSALPQLLQVHFQGRPPYSELRADGSVGGLLADPVRATLQAAGIAHQWVQTPSERQLLLIQSGGGLHCGLGWFRTPDRERTGKFSRAIYQDRPYVALVRSGAPLQAGATPAAALAQPGLVLLAKQGYSYGASLDALISQHPSAVRRTTAENSQMVRMLLAGRADWMLITPDEARPLLQQMGDDAALVLQRVLSGVPAGNTRHLYCHRDVPDALLDAFNRAWSEPR
jgi:polar amino acid transport system substrate-binding protein